MSVDRVAKKLLFLQAQVLQTSQKSTHRILRIGRDEVLFDGRLQQLLELGVILQEQRFHIQGYSGGAQRVADLRGQICFPG